MATAAASRPPAPHANSLRLKRYTSLLVQPEITNVNRQLSYLSFSPQVSSCYRLGIDGFRLQPFMDAELAG